MLASKFVLCMHRVEADNSVQTEQEGFLGDLYLASYNYKSLV